MIFAAASSVAGWHILISVIEPNKGREGIRQAKERERRKKREKEMEIEARARTTDEKKKPIDFSLYCAEVIVC